MKLTVDESFAVCQIGSALRGEVPSHLSVGRWNVRSTGPLIFHLRNFSIYANVLLCRASKICAELKARFEFGLVLGTLRTLTTRGDNGPLSVRQRQLILLALSQSQIEFKPQQRMSAKAEKPTASEQVSMEIHAERMAAVEINQMLRAFKNDCRTNRRILHRMFKGCSKNDAEYVPTIVYYMFGTVSRNNQMIPYFLPHIACRNGVRELSLETFTELLAKKCKLAPSYDQVRRIFRGMKRLGLYRNERIPSQDPETGNWSSRSVQYFELAGWRKLMVTLDKAPKLVKGQKRIKESTLEVFVTDKHRLKAKGNKPQETDVFFETPSGSPGLVISSKGGAPQLSPGEQGISSERVSDSLPVVTLPVIRATGDNQKAATPAAGFSPCSKKLPIRNYPAEEYVSASNLPAEEQNDLSKMEPWEYLLTQLMDQELGYGWRKELYQDNGNFTLKQRIPDCVLQIPDEHSRICGAWSLAEGHQFLPLTQRDLRAGDLLKRCTGCPLRFKDWQQLVRLHSNGSFTIDRLLLILQLTRTGMSDITFSQQVNGQSVDVNLLSVVPEILLVDLNDYPEVGAATLSDEFILRLKLLFPFLYMAPGGYTGVDDSHPLETAYDLARRMHHKALLSPDNVGKVLFEWPALWSEISTLLSENSERHALYRFSGLSKQHSGQQYISLADVEQGVRRSRGVVPNLELPIGLGSDLEAFQHLQDFGGLEQLSLQARKTLTRVMLKTYSKAPQVWLDLEAKMGSEVFAQAMPVRNLNAFRAEAKARLRKQLQETRPPYLSLKPSEYMV